MSIWISAGDEPTLLKATVMGKPGFIVLPEGVDDDDEIVFTSEKALADWVAKLSRAVIRRDDAQGYEEWLDMNT